MEFSDGTHDKHDGMSETIWINLHGLYMWTNPMDDSSDKISKCPLSQELYIANEDGLHIYIDTQYLRSRS